MLDTGARCIAAISSRMLLPDKHCDAGAVAAGDVQSLGVFGGESGGGLFGFQSDDVFPDLCGLESVDGVDCNQAAFPDDAHAFAGAFDLLEPVGRHEDGLATATLIEDEVDEAVMHQRVEAAGGARLESALQGHA